MRAHTTGRVSGVYASFYYGPDRERKQQSAKYVADGHSGIETTIYVFGLYEYEITPAQTHNKYFIQAPDGTQIIYDIQSVSGTQTTYITADHLGRAHDLGVMGSYESRCDPGRCDSGGGSALVVCKSNRRASPPRCEHVAIMGPGV